MAVESAVEPEPDLAFERLPILSQLENDRFCEGCGYNLRMQGVRRDPRLDILLVRCPECGRYHPVSIAGTTRQVWVQRLVGILMLAYILLMLSLIAGLICLEVFITAITLEEAHDAYGRQPYGGLIGSEYDLIVNLGFCASLLAGFVGVALATILFHHWNRLAYLIYAAVTPVPAVLVVWFMLMNAPPSLSLGSPLISLFAGLEVLGGLVGILAGRPVARLLTRVLVPPGLRSYLAFLWSVDGLEPPGSDSRPAGLRSPKTPQPAGT